MAYKPINRSFDKKYLQKQHGAMRWLAARGLTAGEIRTFCLGNIDEDTREIVVRRKEQRAMYYSGLERVYVDEYDREIRLPVAGSPYEGFFLTDKFVSSYMFTREKPRSWRKSIAQFSLYSLSDVQRICRGAVDVAPQLSDNVLTKPVEFATIRVSKLNITKMKTEGARIQV